ncbi:MAG: CRTAC1 family protein [bacterium]|nr:CRTAC1 family protein [bacterium]
MRTRTITALVLLAAAAALSFLAPPSKGRAFRQVIGRSGLGIESSYGGVSWGDYSGDGYLDLLMRQGYQYRLFRNNRDETFIDVTRDAGLVTTGHASSATFGDYDNDGCPDIFVASGFGDGPATPPQLFHSNCDGTFSDVSERALQVREAYHTAGVAWGDYDNDGFLDIYVATYGILHFTKTETSWTITGWTYESNILYRSNGDGTFTNVAAAAGVEGLASCHTHTSASHAPGVQAEPAQRGNLQYAGLKNNWQPVWFDYDSDGWLDLYVSHETTIGVLYRNNRDGTFSDATEEAGLCLVHSTHGVAVGDYDNDGDLDLFAAGSRRNLLWRNSGDGTFTEVSEESGVANFGRLGWSAGFFDYDNDGDLDLYVVSGSTENASFKNDYPERRDGLFRNDGSGQFVDVAEKKGISGNDAKTFGAFGDFNNDGFMDIFVASDPTNRPRALNRLYKNIPNGNHWLTLKLEGTKSNHQGIGAKITVETEQGKQFAEVISGASLLSQSNTWPTFGLGNAALVRALTVRWPSGIVQILSDVNADQILHVREEFSE